MTTLEDLTRKIADAVAGAGLDTSIKLDLKGDGIIHVADGSVSNEDRPADLTVTVSARDLAAMGRGELDPMRAMMTGRLRLSDMAQAMRLQPAIQALFAKAI